MSIPLLFSREVCIELGLFPKFWENSPGKLFWAGVSSFGGIQCRSGRWDGILE